MLEAAHVAHGRWHVLRRGTDCTRKRGRARALTLVAVDGGVEAHAEQVLVVCGDDPRRDVDAKRHVAWRRNGQGAGAGGREAWA